MYYHHVKQFVTCFSVPTIRAKWGTDADLPRMGFLPWVSCGKLVSDGIHVEASRIERINSFAVKSSYQFTPTGQHWGTEISCVVEHETLPNPLVEKVRVENKNFDKDERDLQTHCHHLWIKLGFIPSLWAPDKCCTYEYKLMIITSWSGICRKLYTSSFNNQHDPISIMYATSWGVTTFIFLNTYKWSSHFWPHPSLYVYQLNKCSVL